MKYLRVKLFIPLFAGVHTYMHTNPLRDRSLFIGGGRGLGDFREGPEILATQKGESWSNY